jgi:hypothetical protein
MAAAAAGAAAAAAQLAADQANLQIQQQQQVIQQLQQQMQQFIQQQPQQPHPGAAVQQPAPADAQAAQLAMYQAQAAVQNEMLRQQRKTNATKPVTFTGKVTSDGMTAHTFLIQCNNYFKIINATTDVEKLTEVEERFTDIATTWWEIEKKKTDIDPTKIATWTQFTVAFKKRFQTRDASDTARENIYKLIQKQNTNATEYTQQFITLLDMIDDMGEKDKIASYKQGLPQHMKNKVAPKEFTTLGEYTAYVYKSDAVFRAAQQSSSSSFIPPQRRTFNSRFTSKVKDTINQTETGEEEEIDMITQLAENQARLEAVLARIESTRGTGGGKGNRPNQRDGQRPPPRTGRNLNPDPTPGLPNPIAKARYECKVCIRCNKSGHIKGECTAQPNITDWPEGYKGPKNV